MDIRMKGMDGLEASRKILDEFPEAKILLLTTFSDDEYIVKALRLGTKGYLLKQDYTSIFQLCRQSIPDRLYSARRSCPRSRSFCSLPVDLIILPGRSMNGNWILSG